MKLYTGLLFLLMAGCSESKVLDLTYRGPEVGMCYAFDDEAIKVIGIEGRQYFYKHSWNEQDRIFDQDKEAFRGWVISCGKDGYEFEILAYKLKRAEESIKDLENLTESLRKKRRSE